MATPQQVKRCTKCATEKPTSAFYKQKQGKCGVAPSCKDCSKKRNREAYRKNSRDFREYQASPKGKFVNYKTCAKKRGLVFELDLESFEQILGSTCVYCGVPNSYGIDRVDSSVGYLSFNCVPCCASCNRAKSDLTVAEFEDLVRRIYQNRSL